MGIKDKEIFCGISKKDAMKFYEEGKKVMVYDRHLKYEIYFSKAYKHFGETETEDFSKYKGQWFVAI